MEKAEALYRKILSASGLEKLTWESLLIFFGLTIFCLLLECVIVGWKNSSLKILSSRSKTSVTDIFLWFINAFQLPRLLGLILTFGICYYLVGLVQKSLDLKLIAHIPNVYVQTAILLVVSDFKNYVRHITFHKIYPLWMLHSFHHSATEFTMLTHHRNHFVEDAIQMFFDVIPFVLLGAAFESFFIVSALMAVHQMFIHSNIKSDWGFIGRYVLISPAAHRLHHSMQKLHYNKNMGSLFVWWDRIFGTWMDPEPIDKIGVDIDGYNKKHFVNDMWIGYKGFWKEMIPKKKSKDISR